MYCVTPAFNQMMVVNQLQQQLVRQQMAALQTAAALDSISASAPAATAGTATAAAPAAQNDVLKVSGTTKVNGLAGAVAKRLRLGVEVVVEAMGPGSVGTAVRALCVAKLFTKEMGKQFLIRVESLQSPDGPGIRLITLQSRKGFKDYCESVSFSSLRKVSKASKVPAVAGSLAKTLRTNGTDDVLGLDVPLAPEVLNTALKAVALSRLMVQNNGLDIYISLTLGGEGVQVAIYKQTNTKIVKCIADEPGTATPTASPAPAPAAAPSMPEVNPAAAMGAAAPVFVYYPM